MNTLAIILLSLSIIGLILYFGKFKFEYKIEKSPNNNQSEYDKTSLDGLSNSWIFRSILTPPNPV